MNRIASAIALLAMSSVAGASPFLTCEPYATNDPAKSPPSEFVVTISGMSPIVTPAVSAGTDQVALKLDLGPLNLSGAKTVTVVARNVWGSSAASLPFSFTPGMPASPTGIGLSAN